MQSAIADRTKALAADLCSLLGPESVIVEADRLDLLSSDVYSRGERAALAIAPTDRAKIARAVELIGVAGFAMYPRGGGMSYTGGYVPNREESVVIDMSALNKIIEINTEDMTITVEAGVTWKQVYEALNPKKLRLPLW